MPGARRPTADDRQDAIRIALGGLAGGRDIGEIASDLAALHPRHNTFLGEVLLGLAADALAEAAPTRADPIPYEGIRERYLPEFEFRGRNDKYKINYALTTAGLIQAGIEPDYLDDAALWATDNLWLFSWYALVVYVRIAVERTGIPITELCDRLAAANSVSLVDQPT